MKKLSSIDQDSLEYVWNNAPNITTLHSAIGLLLAGQQAIIDLINDDDKKAKVQLYISSHLLQSINGQHMDATYDIKTESEYLEMVEKKSGALVSMACLVGAALADDKNNSPIIEKYAKNLGIAAQIDNDLCALFRWDEKNDIKTKKFRFQMMYKILCKAFC